MSGADGVSRRRERAEELLAEAHREFREGLSARVQHLRGCLERIAAGSGGEAVKGFFRMAHSLKGTAPSFGAHEVTGPAADLTELGRAWCERRASPEERDLERARVALQQLDDAARRFVESGGGEGEA